MSHVINRPFSPGGLYVSLSNWQGFGRDFLELAAVERNAGCLFLHQTWKRVPKMMTEETADANMDTSSDTVCSLVWWCTGVVV